MKVGKFVMKEGKFGPDGNQISRFAQALRAINSCNSRAPCGP